MREGELAIFFKSAKPGVKSRGDERKVPSSKPLTRLEVGRRAKAGCSATLDSGGFWRIGSLLLLVKDVSVTKVLVNMGKRLAEECMPIKQRLGCNKWDPLMNLSTAMMATSSERSDVQFANYSNVDRARYISQCQSKTLLEIDRNRNKGKHLARHYNINNVLATASLIV